MSKFFKITCGRCNTKFIATDEHHKLDECPKCKKEYVDIETYGAGGSMNITIEKFQPPWFDYEDDYHSCLLTWLNDSDEFYTLCKETEIKNLVYYYKKLSGNNIKQILKSYKETNMLYAVKLK